MTKLPPDLNMSHLHPSHLTHHLCALFFLLLTYVVQDGLLYQILFLKNRTFPIAHANVERRGGH